VKAAAKILWGEGLFLKPQHFQRQDFYHEARLTQMSRVLHPYAWGLRNLQIDQDALAAGSLRFETLSVVFPDGELYSAPDGDNLPEPVNLASLPAGAESPIFSLALAPIREGGGNVLASGVAPGLSTRYTQQTQRAPDLFTAAVESDLATLSRNVRVLGGHESISDHVALPLLRLRRTGTGEYRVDTGFVPPTVSIEAATALHVLLRRLLDMLQAKVSALYGHHREPSKHVIEFRSGDAASFWFMHTASGAYAQLSHLFHQPKLHPERLFEALLILAGQMMTFSNAYTLADLPTYVHADPGPSFLKLDRIIRDLLETVISTRFVAIALAETKPSFHAGRLDSDKLTQNASFYLAVAADMPPAELVETVPMRIKLGAPDDVEKIVISALPGIRLTAAAQVPAAVPVRPGSYYFAVEPRGPLYERMLKAQSIVIYVPSSFRELKLELIAVLQ
jgi:type VI secretion system protein ImpJ